MPKQLYRELQNQEETTAKILRDFNSNHKEKIVLINVLDGAGWVGRQSDYRAVHMCSTYVFHITTLNALKEILQYYC